jgi:formylglycine-generating enzyme
MSQHNISANPVELLKTARDLEAKGNLHKAASVYDKAFGLAPDDAEISTERAALLDRLAVMEHGLVFRYIPGGTFLMGSEGGEPDEQPVHEVELTHYWLSDTPVSWAAYCDLLGWQPPREGMPPPEKINAIKALAARIRKKDGFSRALFDLRQMNIIRMIYGRIELPEAEETYEDEDGDVIPIRKWSYDQKPMVSVAWQEAEELAGY